MVRKRLIFVLLYQDGNFFLSRNFRLQKIGDINWLNKHYNFRKIAFSIDELIVLNVSREKKGIIEFCDCVRMLAEGCFIPIAAGGGICNIDDVRSVLKSGADKIVINTLLYTNPTMVKELVSVFGSQCIIASIDIKKSKDGIEVWINNGSQKIPELFQEWISTVISLGVGEIYLNSIGKDGTGQGYFWEAIKMLDYNIGIPLIISGGAGNQHHLLEGLKTSIVDAVATANLLNFVGNGLPIAREFLVEQGAPLAKWNISDEINLENYFMK